MATLDLELETLPKSISRADSDARPATLALLADLNQVAGLSRGRWIEVVITAWLSETNLGTRNSLFRS